MNSEEQIRYAQRKDTYMVLVDKKGNFRRTNRKPIYFELKLVKQGKLFWCLGKAKDKLILNTDKGDLFILVKSIPCDSTYVSHQKLMNVNNNKFHWSDECKIKGIRNPEGD